MNPRDKIGIWADDRLSEIYFGISKVKRLEWFFNFLVPQCSHIDYETKQECKHRGQPCRLPYTENDGEDDIVWICPDHMHSEGFCWGCHEFWAGCEDFDFDPHGLCSNCRDNPDFGYHDDEEDDEDWEYDYEDYP